MNNDDRYMWIDNDEGLTYLDAIREDRVWHIKLDVKLRAYDLAWIEHADLVYSEALRDNAAFDYHHDNYIAA